MGRSTVHYADNKTNNALKKLHNKLRPAGTPVQRVEYIIELLLLRIFETKIKQDDQFKLLRNLFSHDYTWLNPKTGVLESNENRLFSYLPTVSNDQILSELNNNFFPFYATILHSAKAVYESSNLPQKVQDQLVLIQEVFSNSNFTNNVNSGNLGEVISIVANDIEETRLLQTDLLGDAIESALSETGGTKDIGLFRTPDHIRQFMTAMVEPTFDDIVFDPACGTGGFLFDAFEFVLRRVDPNRNWAKDKTHPELSAWFDQYFTFNQLDIPSIEQSTQFYRSGVTGIEYLGMIRKMAAINFYIRGLNPANIEQGDSLAKYRPVTDHETKSIILANPPFGAERDQESYPDIWQEYSKESETTILFVKLMFEQLKTGGKCAVVVSEGFHTWDQFSAKALRKMLLDEAQLKAVISLPQGLFVSKSGQGPKTSILIFEKGGKTDWTWFYKITNDGYTMGTNRKEQSGSQLVECLTLWHEYVKHGKQPPESKHQFCIPVQWIKTLDPRIKEKIRTETRADMERIGAEELQKLKTALAKEQQRLRKATTTAKKKEASKILLAEQLKAKNAVEKLEEKIRTFPNLLQNRIQNEIAKRIDKTHNYSFNLANYKSTIGETQLMEWTNALNHVQTNGATTLDDVYKQLTNAKPENILPYLAQLNPTNALEADIAREYVSNLESNLIATHKELSTIKEILKSGAKYEKVKLGSVISHQKLFFNVDDDTLYKRVTCKLRGQGIVLRDKVYGRDLKTKRQQIVAPNQLLVAEMDAKFAGYGIVTEDCENAVVSSHYYLYNINQAELLPAFLGVLLQSEEVLTQVKAFVKGTTSYSAIRGNDFLEVEIPLPSLEEQHAIVAQIEKQKAIIEGADLVIKNWKIEILVRDNWSKKQISDIAYTRSGGTPARNEPEYWNGSIPWIKTGEINFNIINQAEEFITKKGTENSSAKLISKGSILMGMYGQGVTRGRVAILGIDATINQACVAMTIKDENEVLSKYLFYYLMTKYDFIRTLSNGTNQENLNQKIVETLNVEFPTIETQAQIVAELDAQMQVLEGLRTMKSTAQQKINRILADVWGVEVSAPETEEGTDE
jgi:type I restriction-modification system DNA methylase subunit/restriction endonuclease S subunit